MSKMMRGIKNLSYLSIGSIIVKIIGFFGIVYIARLLGPEYYGVYVTASAFVGMFSIFHVSGMNTFIIRKGSKNLKGFSTVLEETVGLKNVFLLTGIIACSVAALFTNYETSTKIYVFIFTFSIWARGMEGFISTIYQATEKMKYLPIFGIIETSLFIGLGIMFLKLGFGVFSLVIISSFTPAITLIMRYFHSRKYVNFKFFSKPVMKPDIIRPTLIFSAITFTTLLATKADLLMISFLDTSEVVGIYGVAYKIVIVGMGLLNTIAVAFFPIMVKTFDKRQVSKKRLIQYTLLLTFTVLTLAIIGYFIATDVVVLIFGVEYKESGVILSVLSFYIVANVSTLLFSTSMKATHNENVILISMTIMAIMNIPLNYILWNMYGLIGIAYSTLIVWSTGSMILNIYSYYLLNKQGYLK